MCVAQVGNEKTEGTGLVFLAEEGETEMTTVFIRNKHTKAIGHTWNLDPNEIAGSADALKDLDEYLCDHVVRDDGWEYESSELTMDDLVEFVNETLSVCEFYTDDESVNVYVKDWSADEDFFADKTQIEPDRAIDLLAANPSYWLDETYL